MKRISQFSMLILLALAFVGCDGASDAPGVETKAAPPQPKVGEYTVEIQGGLFIPQRLTVKVGSTITWVNMDFSAQTIRAEDGSFESGSLASGESFSWQFTLAGIFRYAGAQGGLGGEGMTGEIIVVP